MSQVLPLFVSVVTWWYWISILRYWLVLGGTGSEQGGTGCQCYMLSENIWFTWWNHQFIQYLESEKVMTDRQMDKRTDRISYLRFNHFCGRSRVKIKKTLREKIIFVYSPPHAAVHISAQIWHSRFLRLQSMSGFSANIQGKSGQHWYNMGFYLYKHDWQNEGHLGEGLVALLVRWS